MSYVLEAGIPLWSGKAITGADGASFAVLTETIARDLSGVYMLGKIVDVDAESFEILGPAYARDTAAVYLILDTKLKPLKGADPATFRALGESYGVDAARAWYRDKPLRLKKGNGSLSKFRELARSIATDGALLYRETKVWSERAPFDWSRASARVLTHDPWVGEDIAASDGTRAYLLADGESNWVELGAVDIDKLQKIDTADAAVGKHRFLSDGVRVFWRGVELSGADPQTAKALSRDTLVDRTASFVGPRKLPFAPHELAFLDDQFFAGHGEVFIGPDGIYEIVCHKLEPVLLAARSTSLPTADQAFDVAFAVLIDATFRLLDYAAPEDGTTDLAARARSAQSARQACTVERDGGDVRLAVGGKQVASGPISGWYGHICRLWAHLRERRDHLVCYAECALLPDGSAGRRAVLSVAWKDMLTLAGALYREGEADEARIIAHEVLYAHRPRLRLGAEHAQPFADLPRDLAGEARYAEQHFHFTTTTNLAVARHILSSGIIDDADWRVRLEMMRQLNGVTAATTQDGHFLEQIIPEIIRRVPAEPVSLVREAMLGVVEVAAARSGDRGGLNGLLMERVARFLLSEGVNVDLNTVRLQRNSGNLEV